VSLPTRPCGTPEEVEAIGLNARVIPTCAPPDGSKFEGCQMFSRCKCRDKGGKLIKGITPVYDEAGKLVKSGGVAYFGVAIAKPVPGRGVGRSQELMACHQFVQVSEQIKANGGVCEVIAWEGESFKVRGSKKVAPNIEKGEEPGPWKWVNCEYDVRVPKHPRPNERPELMDLSFLQDAKAKEADQEYAAQARIIGRAVESKETHETAERKRTPA
jgi:hypothetical protein